MKLETLDDVLLDSLQDLYHAEKQLTKALPKMAKAASDADLQSAFEEHLDVTEEHVNRLEEVFEELGVKAKGKPCHAMQGIIDEGKEIIEMKNSSSPAALDAALIAAAQKAEHYEISAYGSARAFAEHLGHTRVVELLQQTLDEESETNEKLTMLAENQVNPAAMEGEADSDEDDESTGGARSSGRGGRKKTTSRR